jgi:hypothetical protein
MLSPKTTQLSHKKRTEDIKSGLEPLEDGFNDSSTHVTEFTIPEKVSTIPSRSSLAQLSKDADNRRETILNIQSKAKGLLTKFIRTQFENSPNNELVVGAEFFKVVPDDQIEFLQKLFNEKP